MLGFQGLGPRIVNVVLFGNLVQTVDAGIPTFQTFGQMRPGTHVLIPWPMKFLARLAQQFLNVQTLASLDVSSSFSTHHLNNRCRLNYDATFYPRPNLPNRVRVSDV